MVFMRCIIVEDNSLSIRKGEELMIKMNNGKVINCHAIDTDLGSPWGNVSGFRNYFIYQVRYEIGDINEILNGLIEKIRFYGSSTYTDRDVHKANEIYNAAKILKDRLSLYYNMDKTTEKSEAEKAELDSLLNTQY